METTLVTYFPVVSQQLWQENQRAIGNKPYADYFCKQLKVPVDLVHATQNGPLPPEKTFPPVPDRLNSLFTELSHFPRAVYGVADDGEQGITTCNVTRHFMPGVTVAMMEWWFLWHVAEKERYSLWFPYAHVDNSVAEPHRMNDPHLSYAEKLYGNPNHIIEYIGDTKLDAIIHFTDPVSLGLDKALLERHNLRFSASGWATQADRPDIANTLMLHIGRDVAGGFELYSCYFIGMHQQFSRISGLSQPDVRATAEAAGMNRQMLEALSYEMAVHDMTEFTQLGRMLPQLYRQFAD